VNQENRKKIIVLAILGIVAVGVIVYQATQGFGPTPTTTTKTQPKTAAKTPAKTAAKPAAKPAARTAAGDPATFQEVDVDIDELLRGIEVVNFDYQAERIDRDPMLPLVGIVRPEMGEARLATPSMAEVLRKQVTGIIYDPQAPAAVVDDVVVTRGHVYPDGTLIYEIEPNRVIFRVGDSLIPVEMRRVGGQS